LDGVSEVSSEQRILFRRRAGRAKALRVTVIDLVAKGPTSRLFRRVMNANLASIMPQAIAAWCEESGHVVRYICYLGAEDLTGSLLADTDVLFLSSYTRSALLAYALSSLYRHHGAITVLGGPHARCYPEDAAKYFDYVLGFTDKVQIDELLQDCAPQRPIGRYLTAKGQPRSLPGVRERWKFIEPTLKKAPTIKGVPMIGSMGCPYTCEFCIDAAVKYQPLDFDQMKCDLRFVRSKSERLIVGWHDPNFGIRFDETLSAIEEAVPPGSLRFVAEMSLSLLKEDNLKRLRHNGFVGLLPGIESWYAYGNKSAGTRTQGSEKVRQIAAHINLILRYIPFVQANFILGLDCDEGDEPFELTKRFIDVAPGAFPAFSLFTSYGRATPINLDLQRAGRVRPFPFTFLDSNHAMNVQPLNYTWPAFYERAVDLAAHALSRRGIWRRFRANRGVTTKALNVVRGSSSNRLQYQSKISRMLETDPAVRRYFEGESEVLPDYYRERIRSSLGPLWEALPQGALVHDQNAYLNSAGVT
jgi:hypothetical protein